MNEMERKVIKEKETNFISDAGLPLLPQIAA
jgi:hypothetical protein